MSQSQSIEALLYFVGCVVVGVIPALIGGFRLLVRFVFRDILWNKRLLSGLMDILSVAGVVWPFILFPAAAAAVDNNLEYHFPFGGLQPGWLHFAFAAFPYLLVVIVAVLLALWLPYAMRVDQALAAREQAERTY